MSNVRGVSTLKYFPMYSSEETNRIKIILIIPETKSWPSGRSGHSNCTSHFSPLSSTCSNWPRSLSCQENGVFPGQGSFCPNAAWFLLCHNTTFPLGRKWEGRRECQKGTIHSSSCRRPERKRIWIYLSPKYSVYLLTSTLEYKTLIALISKDLTTPLHLWKSMELPG